MGFLDRILGRPAAPATAPAPPRPSGSRRARAWQAGYDATEDKGQRRTRSSDMRSEDRVLDRSRRNKLTASIRDLRRNMAQLAWAIRCHLDYVSTFSFQARTAIPSFNAALEGMVARWGKPQNFDVAGRLSLPQATRLLEGHATVEGDCAWLLLDDGRIQAIEGDCIGTPTGTAADDERVIQGVRLTPEGAAAAYAYCRRDASGTFHLERWLPAENVLFYAHTERYSQVRGISEISAALDALSDLHEASTYAVLKMKVAAFFAYCFTREAADAIAPTSGGGEGEDESPYQVDFGRGPVVLDLEPGDKMEAVESKSPSVEFQSFAKTTTMVGLKCLDLPYSFFSEDFTTYSGARQALLQYEKSAKGKRRRPQTHLENWTRWRSALAILDGELLLPGGYTTENLPFEWVPEALPWIAPKDEVDADCTNIAAGLTSRTRVCRRHNEDFQEIVGELAAENALLLANGLPTALPVGGSPPAPAPDTPNAPQGT